MDQVKIWKNYPLEDQDLVQELEMITGNEDEIKDRFYRNLEFGTGGLRGVIGVGTNRMNIYTVAKATQGYSDYLLKHAKGEIPSVAIAYDSRIKSDYFAKTAAEVFAANGIKVLIYKELMPTPALSFAVRYLNCAGGIVITASHNPAKYNGYKVYGSDGCQITTGAASEIISQIEQIDLFTGVKRMSYEDGISTGMIQYIEEEVITAYINAVSTQSLCGDEIDKSISVIYTPLYGAGLKPVVRCLKENGFMNISVLKEQEEPNGEFPTCPYPNPEIKEALQLAIDQAKISHSELVLATDPDCDRVGIAVREKEDYVLLSGNEVGMLLLEYICQRKIELGTMPDNPMVIKTIVTIDMVKQIAKNYGVEVQEVLTGFKFIGEQIGILEKNLEESRYLLGFEESYGYLTGTFVRDKDAVNASLLICEMCAYYKEKGFTLVQVLNQLYERYGYCLNTLHSYTFEGADGLEKMQEIMKRLRTEHPRSIAGFEVQEISDYKKSEAVDQLGQKTIIDLPKSDVLKFILEDHKSVVVRPSGTEPKLKIYISVSADYKQKAEEIEMELEREFSRKFK